MTIPVIPPAINQLPIIAIMAVAALLGAIGQIMLRLASEKSLTPIKALLTNWPLYGFAIVYGVAVLINIWAYKIGGRTSIIYPTIALSYVFASLIAWKWLGEPINTWVWGGTAIIVVGVAVIGYGSTL